jgi:hypothetical protein
VAVPFGGHPTLEQFLEWATKNGCKAVRKTRTHSIHRRTYEVLEITGPDGAQVVIANPDLQEHLAPSEVSYLHRRLGVRSPFPALPEQPDPEQTEYIDDDDGMPLDPSKGGGDA